MRRLLAVSSCLVPVLIGGCGLVLDLQPRPDLGPETDFGVGRFDAGGADAARADLGLEDQGVPEVDFGFVDAEVFPDAGPGPCATSELGASCDPSGTSLICVDGECVPSVCGDGFIDVRRGEQCEDGNDLARDGCEPVTCTFSCSSPTDCARASDCVAATCAAHRCRFELLSDNTPCASATGVTGSCTMGVCRPARCGDGQTQTGEECDDGANSDPFDGCTPDCRFSCRADTDCDTANMCDGQSGCVNHRCSLSVPVECLGANPCLAVDCDPNRGCFTTLLDEDGDGHAPIFPGESCGDDCDDGNPSVHGGAPELCNNVDDDCDGRVDDGVQQIDWFPDRDRDGFGGVDGAVRACASPGPGYTQRGGDCYDSATDPRAAQVFPGQTQFFDTTYCVGVGLGMRCGFDYNCDARPEPQFPQLARTCGLLGPLQCSSSGWSGNAAPECGVLGAWQDCNGIDIGPAMLLCRAATSMRKQPCR